MRNTWNRRNTFDLLMSFDNMLSKWDLIMSEFRTMFLFSPFFTNIKLISRTFQTPYIYKDNLRYKYLPKLLITEERYNIAWTKYVHRYKKSEPWTRKILWLMYEYYNEEWWFKIVEDVSYENIWLRQIYENDLIWLDLIIDKFEKNSELELKQFVIPKIFIHNDNIYKIV